MSRTRKLATVAIAAVLGIVITTTTTIGTGIFVQQANAASCLNVQVRPCVPIQIHLVRAHLIMEG